MKKIIILAIIIFAALWVDVNSQARKDDSDLKKYLTPAEITRLDWILLNVKVDSFGGEIAWDDYGIVKEVGPYVAYYKNKHYVGLVVLVDKKQYIKLENHIIEKVFINVVESASEIIKISIPELETKRDVFANFVAVGKSGEIAHYIDGKLKFIE